MNGYLILAFASTVLAVAAVAWALMERQRARMLGDHAELAASQMARSAEGVAEAILKRNEEAVLVREQAAQAKMEAQLAPVAKSLKEFQEHVAKVEKQRAEETGGLKEQITALLLASTATQDEARKLSSALRRGAGVQGRWGEQTLRNVLEQAGLSSFCDFTEQASTDSDEGRRRPDVSGEAAGRRRRLHLIDAETCSLNAFLELQDRWTGRRRARPRACAMCRACAAMWRACRPRPTGTSSRTRRTSWRCSCRWIRRWPPRSTGRRP